MSLFDIKKNAEERAAQELAERQHQELMRKLDVHPLVNLGCGRDVRDSYFAGIVFASLADDEAVDDAERNLLLRIGSSLGLPEEDRELIVSNVASAIAEMVKSAAQHVFDLLEEVAVDLKEDAAFKIFVAEFIKVCAVKKFEADKTKEVLVKYVAPRSGHKMEDVPFDALCRVAVCGNEFDLDDLFKLSDWLGEDATCYLMLDVFEDDVKPILDAHRTMLDNCAALPAKLVEIIEGDDTWPVEFKTADYQPLFDAAGIAEADAGAFVARELLPFMKRACELARGQIKKVEVVDEDDIWKLIDERSYGAKFEGVKEFRILFRYAFFLDKFLDLVNLSADYYFCGPSEHDYSYYFVYARDGDISRARRAKSQFPFNDCFLDRFGCPLGHFGSSIWDDEAEKYFAQWDRLFADIENFVNGNVTGSE